VVPAVSPGRMKHILYDPDEIPEFSPPLARFPEVDYHDLDIRRSGTIRLRRHGGSKPGWLMGWA